MKKHVTQKGLTLIELLISLTLLGIVLAIGYNFFFYTNKTYSETEKKWSGQTSVQQVAEFINAELKTAYYAEINYTDTQAAGDIDLYLDGGKLKYKKYEDSEPVQITGGSYSITFEKAKKGTWSASSPESNRINNTITYTIKALDDDGSTVLYTLQSSVFLENMLEDRAISGNYTGNSIRYKRTSKDSPVPTPDDISSCFIATAAYGSGDDASVRLLRQFRDNVLLKTSPGKAFVSLYYRVSPPIADIISGNGLLKMAVRLLLTPVVGFASVFVYPQMMVLCIILLFIYSLSRRIKKKIIL